MQKFLFDATKIQDEMDKVTKREVLISLVDNYVSKVITRFAGEKVVLVETIVNILSYQQQFILYKYFDKVECLEDLVLSDQQKEKIALLIKFDKYSTVVNNNASEKDVLGFEDYVDGEIDELDKMPDRKYEDTRDMIFDLMEDQQEIAEYYEEIDANKIKEGIKIIKSQMKKQDVPDYGIDVWTRMQMLEKEMSNLHKELYLKQLAEKMVAKMETCV